MSDEERRGEGSFGWALEDADSDVGIHDNALCLIVYGHDFMHYSRIIRNFALRLQNGWI
jgi:hypothetical protein